MKKMIFGALSPILLMIALPLLEMAGLLPDVVSAFLFNNMVTIGMVGLGLMVLIVALPIVLPKIMDMRKAKK
jgi:hypothetical protein